jgi:hypothetical protein
MRRPKARSSRQQAKRPSQQRYKRAYDLAMSLIRRLTFTLSGRQPGCRLARPMADYLLDELARSALYPSRSAPTNVRRRSGVNQV